MSLLEIDGEFRYEQFGQEHRYGAGDKAGWIAALDLFGASVQEAKADRSGNLFLVFSNGVRLTVEDGPYENWHYTRINNRAPEENLHVHGGVGRTVW